MVLRDVLYNVLICLDDTNVHYDIFALQGMVEAIRLCKQGMRLRAYGHMFCFALQFFNGTVCFHEQTRRRATAKTARVVRPTLTRGGKRQYLRSKKF